MLGFSISSYYIVLFLIAINYVKLRFCWNWTTSQASIVIDKSENWLNLGFHILNQLCTLLVTIQLESIHTKRFIVYNLRCLWNELYVCLIIIDCIIFIFASNLLCATHFWKHSDFGKWRLHFLIWVYSTPHPSARDSGMSGLMGEVSG